MAARRLQKQARGIQFVFQGSVSPVSSRVMEAGESLSGDGADEFAI